MEFAIHHSSVITPDRDNAIGLEVQPPLSEVAAASIVAELTRRKDDYSTGTEHFAETALVTRNDQAGTAFLVRPNSMQGRLTSLDVAQVLGALINPARIHDVTYNPIEAQV